MISPLPGSYRDRHSRVSVGNDSVVREFDPVGAEWFLAAVDSGLIGELTRDGLLVAYETVSVDPFGIRSPRLPFVTYPYEWTGEMLRDAGLLTLEIARRAWDAGFHLRDASAFNVVFSGGRPVMVDLGSFRPGHTAFFLAYGQFCDHFLNPLALASATKVSQRSAWSSLEGLSAVDARRLVRSRLLRPGLTRNIWARAALEMRSAGMEAKDQHALREGFGLSPAAIRRMFDKLTDVLVRLDIGSLGAWEAYERSHSYTETELALKAEFVRGAAVKHAGSRAVDVGANVGRFSEILAQSFASVVAVESDEATVEILYQRQKRAEISPRVVPMVVDIADPTPGRGFAGRERQSALDRLAGADLIVWLAVFHHLVVSRNIPLPMLFDFAAEMSPNHVIEHVSPDDEMSKLLLTSRNEDSWPFDRETFEAKASTRFLIVASQEISPTRTLYELVRK